MLISLVVDNIPPNHRMSFRLDTYKEQVVVYILRVGSRKCYYDAFDFKLYFDENCDFLYLYEYAVRALCSCITNVTKQIYRYNLDSTTNNIPLTCDFVSYHTTTQLWKK